MLLLAAILILHVRETAGIARTAEVVRSGVPLARSLGVTSTAPLAVLDANGTAVAAEFRILARWNAPLSDTSAPVQWLLVSFPATPGDYQLCTAQCGSRPAVLPSIRITRNADQVTVDTGPATFTLGSTPALFDAITRAGNPLVGGGTMIARINDTDTAFASTRRIAIEQGELSAVVTIDGTYGLPHIASRRRYVFTAGSPAAIVTQTLTNEDVDAIRVQRVRDTLRTQLDAPLRATAIGARSAAPVTGPPPLALRQLLRSDRHAPPAFTLGNTSGAKADGGLLALAGGNGTLAIALDHMHRYEPQALRALDDGTLALDLADDDIWIGPRQAMYATFAVAALPATSGRAELDRVVWAPLNRPLRAWPDASWFAASDAVGEFPAGPLPAAFADYDRALLSALNATQTKIDEVGTYGLMTFGSFPRLWGTPIYSDEVDCGPGDPTPSQSSDDTYWCATWTDYHNTSATAAVYAMRSGDVAWLDEISRPAALRMLYTQIMQCAPDDDYFYCGQAPAGYGGFRADFNSSHAYFQNLYLHYWLTGDTTVIDTLTRGSRSMREYYCTRRPAAPCQPDDPPTDEYANFTGRVASQWFATFRFVGLAGGDGSYLDDYRANLARAVTQQYVAVDRDGKRYGFLCDGPLNTTDQLWMTALYDTTNLERLQRDTGDAPIGNPPVRPSEVLLTLARTFVRFGPLDGTADGRWPNQLDFTWSGPRIGGTLLSVSATPGGSDPLLYDTGKATLAGPIARAALLDPSLHDMAMSLTILAIRASLADGSPLGKLQGEYLTRLHQAVANLAPPAPPRRRVAGH